MKKTYSQIIPLLDKFSSSFSRIGTLEEMAKAVEEILVATYGVEYTGLYLFDPSEERLKLLQATGFSLKEIAAAEATAMERHPGLVYRTKKMIYIPDTRLDKASLSKSSERNFEVRSRLFLPVMNGEEVVGAFGIVDSKPNAYNEEDIAILSFICNLSGALYANILNQKELRKMALIAKEIGSSAVISNKTGEIDWVNKAFTQLTGYELEEVKGKRPGQVLQGEETDQRTVALLSEAIKNKKPIEVDILNYSKSKQKYWVNLQIQPIFDSGGNLEYFISIQKEITKDKEIEEELKKNEIRYSKLVSNINDVIVIIDKEGINQYKSPNSEMLFGWKPEELVGRSALENIHPEDLEAALKILGELGESIIPKSIEFRYRCKDGHYAWVEFTASNLMNDPDINGFLGNYHDITVRKQAEFERNKQSELINLLLDSIPDVIFFKDLSGIYVGANPAFCQLIGQSKEDLIGKTDYDLFDKEIAEKFRHNDREMLKINHPRQNDEWVTYPDGSKRLLDTVKTPYCDAEGNMSGILGISRDITDRELAEEKLKESESKFNKIFDSSPALMLLLTISDRRIVAVNDTMLQKTGMLREEMVGKLVMEVPVLSFAENQPEIASELLKDQRITGMELQITSSKGDILDGVLSREIIESYGQKYFLVLITDITQIKQTEIKLRATEERFNKLSEHSRIFTWEVDVNGLYTYASDTSETVLGYRPEELVGKMHFYDLHPESEREAFKAGAFEIFAAKETFRNLENSAETKQGQIVWLSTNGIPVLDSENNLIGYSGTDADITERKVAEEAFHNSELRNRAITDAAHDAILMMDNEGHISFWNPAAERIFGYSNEEAIGRNLHTLLVPSRYHAAHLAAFPKFQETGEGDAVGKTLDLQALRKDGKEISIQISLSAVQANGIWHSVGILRDVSERKRAEEELNKLFRAVEQSPVMTYITDLHGLIEYVNPKVIEISGYSREEIIGKNPRIFGSGINLKGVYADLWQTISAGKNWKGELHNKKKSGELYWVTASLSPVFDGGGMLSHYIAVEEDITQQKEDLEALQIANLRFRSLISSMQSAVMVEDENRKIIIVNQHFCDLFSIPLLADQLIGAECTNAAEESKLLFANPEMFVQDINNTLKIHQVVTDFELQMVNGKSLERDFIPLDDAEKKNHGILWIYRDISERKKTEGNLLRQSQILSGTAQAMNYLLTLHEHDQAIQKALETIGIATGVDRVYIFEKTIDADSGEVFFSQQFEWTAMGIAPQIENPELQNMPYSQNFPNWYNTLKAGRTVSGLAENFPEHERRILEDEDIKSIIAAPIFVGDQLWGMVGFDDCTRGIDWSTNELSIITALAGSIGGSISKRIVENELIEARHVAEYATKTKSEFLATMSHEIRTPMNGVIGMTSLLMQTELSPAQLEYAETIRISGELLLSVINDILDFSKIESAKLTLENHPFNLVKAIEDVLDLLSSEVSRKKLGLYFQVDPLIPSFIKGDLTRLRQILVNLTANAVKFTQQGEIVIGVKQIDLQGEVATLEFSVKDTGVGIPEDKISLLFKPFSQLDGSTTRKYGGTGLGLAICAELVSLMEGKIHVESNSKGGSEFIFTIKITYSTEQVKEEHSYSESDLLKGKNILIVDSNQTSRTILNNLFKNQGMEPFSVSSAKMALGILHVKSDFSVLLFDDNLPDMSSKALIDEIKLMSQFLETPSILQSYHSFSTGASPINDKFSIRINKPVKQTQLVSSIARLISSTNILEVRSAVEPRKIERINEKYPLNILVAEDNTINQRLILKLFELLGYNVALAANGLEVIKSLSQMKIDIIFMDIQMPEMDGLEATRLIIQQWGEKRPMIVAMTANALQTDKEKYLAAGMDDYISKPLTIDHIKAGIEKWAPLCHKSR